jgi:hypothetical protein
MCVYAPELIISRSARSRRTLALILGVLLLQGCTTTWVNPGEDQALASRDEKLCELEATKASAIGDTANRRAAVGDMAHRRRLAYVDALYACMKAKGYKRQ